MKTETAKHTPGPYFYVFRPGVGGPGGRYVMKSDTADRIAIFSTNGLGPDEDAEANAESFTRACNCHDDLLEACTTALSCFRSMEAVNNVEEYAISKHLKATIDKAEPTT